MAQLKTEGRAPLAVLSGGNGVHKGRSGAHAVTVQASAAVAAPPDVPVLPAPATPPQNVFVFIEPSPFSHVCARPSHKQSASWVWRVLLARAD